MANNEQRQDWPASSATTTVDAGSDIAEQSRAILAALQALPLAEQVAALNDLRTLLHDISPFRNEPVDCVLWVPLDSVYANDYNPNSVAPPEMELLRVSIDADGYTQPIVSMRDERGKYEVVDGFHRNRVGRECEDIRQRVSGYLPVVRIREAQNDKTARMASTIRHNRARGKHKVEAMSDIVVELKHRNWTDARISKELGMDEDEILRLCQITGLAGLFSDSSFSRAWDVEGSVTEDDFEALTDNPEEFEEEATLVRTVNTSDEGRVFHTFDSWECHKAGFYAGSVPGKTREECEEEYRAFFSDLGRFREGLQGVTTEWVHSCEHYLTNTAMNRIAWLGQAAMCYTTGVPAAFRSGFSRLTASEQRAANELALEFLNKWLRANNHEAVDMESGLSGSRQSDIY